MEEDDAKFDAVLIDRPRSSWMRILGGIVAFLVLFFTGAFAITGFFACLSEWEIQTGFVPWAVVFIVTLVATNYTGVLKNYPPTITGTLVMDRQCITTNDRTFKLKEIEWIYAPMLEYKGQTFNSDAADSNGENFITIKYNGEKHTYTFVLEHSWHRERLRKYMLRVNILACRELFITKGFWMPD